MTNDPTQDQDPEGPASDAEIAAAREGDAAAEQGGDQQEEIAALKDQLLRAMADVENTRRRAEREKIDAGRYAISKFAQDLLSVADNFDRALGTLPEDGGDVPPEAVKGLLTGIKMTNTELYTIFERHGVKRIDPKGEKFDPNLHQAVAQAPSDAPAGAVADVAQAGFVIGDRVLRAAMVVVSTGPAAGATPTPAAANDAGEERDDASEAPGGAYTSNETDEPTVDKKV